MFFESELSTQCHFEVCGVGIMTDQSFTKRFLELAVGFLVVEVEGCIGCL